MRVAILSRDFPPRVGGIGDHTDHLAAELARRGNDVTVLCSPPAEGRDAFAVRATIERWDGRKVPSILRALPACDAIVWQYNPFAIGRRGLAPWSGRLARALAARAPLVVLAHELWFPWGREGARGLAWAAAQRLQTRAVLRHAAAVLVTTERRAAEVRRIHRRVRVAPVGANIEPDGRPRSRDALAPYGVPDEAFVVAHFGSVGPGRDIGPAVEAIAALRAEAIDARLLLAGNAGPFPKPPSLNGALVETGVLPRAQLSAVLAAADCYVHPDRSGPAAGRRGSLVAALAHGLPVVAYAGADRAPQLADGRDVLIVSPEPRALADALRALARDPVRARAIGDAARATYEAAFSWPRCGDAVAAALAEVTA